MNKGKASVLSHLVNRPFCLGEAMKKARRWIVLIFMVLTLIYLDSSVAAQDTELSRQTLSGLQGVWVSTGTLKLKPEIERDGLTKDQLQTDAELKLRMAGIKVLSLREVLITPGQPCLYIAPNISKYPYRPSGYFFSIFVCLEQDVFLVRSPNIKNNAITWSVSEYGITPELKTIREIIKNLVDKFINAYLSVNPK